MMVALVENLFLVTDFMPGNVHADVVYRPHRTPALPVLQCTCKHVCSASCHCQATKMVRLLRTHEENTQVLQSESKVWSIIMSTCIHVCTYGRGFSIAACHSLQ